MSRQLFSAAYMRQRGRLRSTRLRAGTAVFLDVSYRPTRPVAVGWGRFLDVKSSWIMNECQSAGVQWRRVTKPTGARGKALTSRLSASRLTNDDRHLIPLNTIEQLLAVFENRQTSSLSFKGEVMSRRTRDGRAAFLRRSVEG